jgi:hypothetical protein
VEKLLIYFSLQILLACDVDEREENAYEFLVGKFKEKKPLERTRHGWEENIK